MPLKNFKPITPGQRNKISSDFSEITKKNPEKSLLMPLNKKAGRSNSGKISVRRRGGGHKRRYRLIDFERSEDRSSYFVEAIEYDPNRSARIALIKSENGKKSYIIAPLGLSVGQNIFNGKEPAIDLGNSFHLKDIPVGTFVHNVEMKPGKGAQLARSAGTVVQVMAHEYGYTLLRLPSGEARKILRNSSIHLPSKVVVAPSMDSLEYRICDIESVQGYPEYRKRSTTLTTVAFKP